MGNYIKVLQKLHSTDEFSPDMCSRVVLTHFSNGRWFVRFQVLTAASMMMVVFWVVAPCSLVEFYRRFKGACCLHHQGDARLHSATTQKTAIFINDFLSSWDKQQVYLKLYMTLSMLVFMVVLCLRNVGIYLNVKTAFQSRGPTSTSWWPWTPHFSFVRFSYCSYIFVADTLQGRFAFRDLKLGTAVQKQSIYVGWCWTSVPEGGG
jgi:hypothetical protein